MATLDPEISARIRSLVIECCESEITEADIETTEGGLAQLGFTSLSYIRLLDAIENECGVYIDLESEDNRLRNVGGLIEVVHEELEQTHA